MDIQLDKNGDIRVSDIGDISITDSVRQEVLIRIRWIYQEWRLGPEIGFPWFEEVFVKNPNTVKIQYLLRDEIMKVEKVTGANVKMLSYDSKSRSAKFFITVEVEEEIFEEEVILNG